MSERFVMDTVGQAFFERELTYVAQQTYDRKYPALTARQIFPVASNFDPGAQSVAFRSFGRQGQAKILADGALDVPVVDVFGAEVGYPVVEIGMGYNYTDLELIRAQQTRTRLDEKRAFAAREAIETKMNNLAFNGDSTANLPGLFDNADIGSGDATYQEWTTTATAAQIVESCQDWYTSYINQSSGIEVPNTIALAPNAYARVAVTAYNDYTDRTILQWLLSGALPGINTVIMCPDCASVSAMSSDDVGVMYRRDPMALELKLPMELKVFPAQQKGLGYHVPMYMRYSGLHIYYPKSIYVLKGLQEQ